MVAGQRIALVVAGAVLVAACFNPSLERTCGRDEDCLNGFSCDAQHNCVSVDVPGSEAPGVDAPGGEAPGVDAPPDAGDDGGPPPDAPSAPGWTLVQTTGIDSSRTLGVNRVGAHHLVVVAIDTESTRPPTLTDNSGCNAYIPIPGAQTCALAGDALHIYYAKDSCAGATTISVDANVVSAIVAWEVSGIRTDEPLDTAAARGEAAASREPLGPSITTSSDGAFVVSVAIVEESVMNIYPGNEFTNDHFINDNGWAHLTDPRAKAGDHQAQWESSSGRYCASAVAFKAAP